jgi:hypothetical protein
LGIGVKSTTEGPAMTVRFERTPKGEVAILPRAEYERLKALADEAIEDAGTACLAARARKEVAKGVPLLTKETVDRLTNRKKALGQRKRR